MKMLRHRLSSKGGFYDTIPLFSTHRDVAIEIARRPKSRFATSFDLRSGFNIWDIVTFKDELSS